MAKFNVEKAAKLDQMKDTYLQARHDYYNGDQSCLTDSEYDKLEDKIRKLDPGWSELKKTGVKVANKKTEVDLVEPMPSLSKMYDEAVPKFYAKYPKVKRWIWMDKLDGTSLQLVYQKGKPTHLITRGDGTKGGDISFFIPHLVKLKSIPESIPTKEQTVFRLEGLMKKKIFEKKWSSQFDNGRNLVNGLFNRKDMHPALVDVDLVVLGVYGSTLSKSLEVASNWMFDVVRRSEESKRSAEDLKTILKNRRDESCYEMDGLVIAPTDWVMHYEDAEKPKQLIAYKHNDEENAAQVKVKCVIYQTSSFGRIVPKVEIEPTKLDGVVVKYCTVHNAKWMLDRGIGPGAIVKMVRSGGVIPKIVGVVKKGKIQLPDIPYELQGVHFMALEDSEDQDIRIIDRFLTTLGIEFIAKKTIAALYDIGLTDCASYIKLANASDKIINYTLAPAEFGPVQGKKIIDELKRVLCNEISLKQLMVASSCFESIGERKLSSLEKQGVAMGDMLLWKREDWIKMEIHELEGFQDKTVLALINGVKAFKEWFSQVEKYLTVNGSLPVQKKKKTVGNKLSGVVATFTGYRDQEQVAMIEALGGTVVDFSTKTTVLLYKEGGRKSSKIEKAGDKAMTWEQFITRYGVN